MDAEICQQQRVARILAYFMTRAQWIQASTGKVTRLAADESLRVILRLQRMVTQLVRAANGGSGSAPAHRAFDMTRSKFLSLTSLAASPALAVIAAILLLGGPDEPPTRAIASMGPHALATMVLRVPQ